jgi:uridine kinase
LGKEVEIGPTTQKMVFQMFKRIIRWAESEDDLEPTGILLVTNPISKKPKQNFWDADQRDVFLRAIEGSKYHFLWKFALFTGMRAGEIAALKIPCQCRKPAIGMIETAQAEWNIDLKHSWFIGDTTVDMQTAHKAGVRSILLETGYGGLDARYPIVADYTLPNLAMAVEFILKTHPELLKQCKEWVLPVMPGEVIIIGGLSRSGKSIFASALKEGLRERCITTHILALDGWLKPEDEREPGVLGRYDVRAIKALFKACINRGQPMTLAVPIYDKKARAAQAIKQSLTIGVQDVIIIEGAVAAALAPAVPVTGVHTWFVEIDESVRKERVLREYARRAKTLDEAVSIYEKRLLDENPIVLESRKNTQRTLDLGLGKDLG